MLALFKNMALRLLLTLLERTAGGKTDFYHSMEALLGFMSSLLIVQGNYFQELSYSTIEQANQLLK